MLCGDKTDKSEQWFIHYCLTHPTYAHKQPEERPDNYLYAGKIIYCNKTKEIVVQYSLKFARRNDFYLNEMKNIEQF